MSSSLLGDYAAGELTAPEAAVVRGWLAASAAVRERLAVIWALVDGAARAASPEPPTGGRR